MTPIGRYTLVGFGIRCAIPDCKANTADQAPSAHWRTPEAAVRAAQALLWIHAALAPGEPHVWFCPLHQRRDPSSGRWVPAVTTDLRAEGAA